MIALFRSFILAFAVCCTSCTGSFSRKPIRIGIDRDWYSANFGPQTSYVNGYIEDLLMEIAQYGGLRFELVGTDSENLLAGMESGKFHAAITTLPAYEYHLAKYDFSENVLDLGPVLIVPSQSKKNDLASMKGEMIGIVSGDPAALLLEKHPSLVIRAYNTIPDLLNAVVRGDIQGALLNQIPAVNYIHDLYRETLRVAGRPLTHDGIHFAGPKGTIGPIHQNIEKLRKKKAIDLLLKKWGFKS